MSKPILYISYVSGPCRSIVLALKKAGALDKIELKEINLGTGEQLSPEYLAINPFHTVPALKHDDLSLYESTAIIEYLFDIFELHGEYGLPKDTVAKYKTINALHKYHNFIAPAQRNFMGHYYATIFSPAPFDLEAFKAGLEKTKAEQWTMLDQMLEKNGGFVTGATPTVADIHYWIDTFQTTKFDFPAEDLTTLHIYDFDQHPHIQKWLKVVKAAVYDEEISTKTQGFIGMATAKMEGKFKLLDQQ